MTLTGPGGSDSTRDRVGEGGGTPDVTLARHMARVGQLMILAGLLLGWLAAHTDVLFADGPRYIAEAQALERGTGGDIIKKSVDHPVYPLAVAAVHRALGGDGPDSWQAAAQLASIVAGVLLVIPLYLVSRELFGDACAAPACFLVYAVPLTGHVFADTLSESTFLLFWMWGLWASLRFLKSGAFGWVPLVVGFSALAYLSRPEGLLLPAALVAALGLSPRWVFGGLRGSRGLAVLAALVVGSACLVGPYVAQKGGLGTKPSIARLLGTAAKSAAHAVERQRPLRPGQTATKTYALAAKAVANAVTEAVTWPLILLAVVGLLSLRPRDSAARQWRLLAVIGVASVLALVRLHATSGYCSPRHAMILALIAIPAASFGLGRLLAAVAAWGARVSDGCLPTKPVGWAVALGCLALVSATATLAPVNEGLGGYKDAGRWLSDHAGDGSRVVDVTGWSQFYSRRSGYTFENLVAAPADPAARWVVVREAHLRGPWEYCQRLRALVDGLEPVVVFRGSAWRRPTRILLFDREPLLARGTEARPAAVRR